jgi:hypothetical protein
MNKQLITNIKTLRKNKEDHLAKLDSEIKNKEKYINDNDESNKDKLKRELESLKNQKENIEKEITILNNQIEQIDQKDKTFYLVSSKGQKENNLLDLRNINEKNFRKNKDGGQNESPSKSYFMNKDFLIIDSLAIKCTNSLTSSEISQIVHGIRENIEKAPLIQPLILNEFQPYDMLSPADLMPGSLLTKVTDGGKNVINFFGGNVIVALGKNTIMKNSIDEYSKHPSKLYRSTEQARTRTYFSSDPVQVVQNMFNGRKMVKYIPNSILW